MIGRTAYQSEVYSMFGRTAQPECRIFIIRRAAHPNQSEGFSIIGRAAYQSEGYSMFGRTAQSECRIFNDWTNCPISVKDFHLRGRISNQSVGLSMIGQSERRVLDD